MSGVSSIGDFTSITMTRGDSLFADLALTKDGEPFTPEEGDLIFFSCENEAGATVMGKTIPIDTLRLSLYPEDTRALRPGNYKFSLRLVSGSGSVVDTFVKGKLRLEKEVE